MWINIMIHNLSQSSKTVCTVLSLIIDSFNFYGKPDDGINPLNAKCDSS